MTAIGMQMYEVPGDLEGIFGEIGVEFFAYVLPWLLTFAIVYGILSHIGKDGLPESNPARAIIGIVLAFIIAPALSPFVPALMQYSAGFVILIAGFLVFIVLLEVFGIKAKKPIVGDEGPTGESEELSIFEEYPKFFAFVIGVLALLVFFGSGASEAAGINIPSGVSQNYPLLFFLGFMVLVVWWMISE
ncbi:MAG: hypothetical protein ACLFM9_00295 [Candidatus Aenigmatarchaeota archaeon]